MKFNLFHAVVAGTLATTGVATAVLVAPMMAVQGFEDYEPPDRLDITLYNYTDGRPGHGGSPASGNRDTDIPTWQLDLPYRAYFYGGKPDGKGGYDPNLYVVMSREPILDGMVFTYAEPRSSKGGYMRADFSAIQDTKWRDLEWHILWFEYGTKYSSSLPVPMSWNFDYPHHLSPTDYFYFDFVYECCSTLDVTGMKNITETPYPYLLTCKDGHGGSGGASSGSSSDGSGGSGGSSGGDGSGGSSGGNGGSSGGSSGGDGGSSGNESSKGDWESDREHPWESSDNEKEWSSSIPEYPGGGEGDTGERGDTWELPTWEVPEPPIKEGDISLPEFPFDLEQSFPELPDMEYSRPDAPFPDLEESYPDIPGGGNMTESYPDPYLPGGSWPPPFPY